MKSTLLKVVAAGALVAVSTGTFAAPVVLDFEALGRQAIANDGPIAVSNVAGFNFSGAFAYAYQMLDSSDNAPDPTNFGGFLINRSRMADTNSIIVSLEELEVPAIAVRAVGGLAADPLRPSNVFPGRFFQEISFQMFTAANNPRAQLIASNAAGNTATIELSAGNSNKFWRPNGPYLFNPQDQFTQLEFRTDGAVLGLDDMSITLSAPGGGGNVPEPASYALVGLALLAAGSITRRRG